MWLNTNMKFIFKYFSQATLIALCCFTSLSLSKSSSSKLKDILSGTASNIRPGMLTNNVYSLEDNIEGSDIRTQSNDTYGSSPSEVQTSENLSRKVDVRTLTKVPQSSALRRQSASGSTIKTAGVLSIITFSTILILFNK